MKDWYTFVLNSCLGFFVTMCIACASVVAVILGYLTFSRFGTVGPSPLANGVTGVLAYMGLGVIIIIAIILLFRCFGTVVAGKIFRD